MRQTLTNKGSKSGRRIVSALICLIFLGLLAGVAKAETAASEYYAADGQIVAISPALDTKSVSRAAARFRYLYDTYLAPNDMHVYVAIVPDKSYYLPDAKGRGQMDYDALFSQAYSEMDYAIPIDLTECLDADSYYATDSHWRQECLLPVAEQLADQMLATDEIYSTGDSASANEAVSTDGISSVNEVLFLNAYETEVAADHFIGSYADALTTGSARERRQFAAIEPDTIRYLTNDVLDQAVVHIFDTDTDTGVYDRDKLDSRNPYDFYLSGPVALMHITNPLAETNRQLVVFRDSYGSSLVPLLVPYYKEILVVDIRYMMSDRLGEMVDFTAWTGADALYLYSTTLLNRSISLR